MNTEKDSVFFTPITSFEMLDLRKEKSNMELDNWEKRVIVDKNNNSAKILFRGVDNGINVEYIFEKKNETWKLIEIIDSST
jgi:hypothetical protein